MKVEIELELKSEADSIEAYRFFKYLQGFVERRFIRVTDFKCQKKLYSKKVTVSFEHSGYTLAHKDPELKLFYNELEYVNAT